MRILIVTHYFPPEVGAPQARLSELARAWAAAGDDVTVLTGMPNHPTGVIPPAYRRAVRRRERVDGYTVVRTWLYATPNEKVLRRTLGHLSFMVSAALLGGRVAGPADIVVVSSPTFFSIGAAWVLARCRRARLVVEVRDLWPAVFRDLGVVTNRVALAVLERLELAAYRAATAVVVVTEGFRANLIDRGVPPAKVHTIRNGADLQLFTGDTPSNIALRTRLGAGRHESLVLYAGAHGISHALPVVADAAQLLRDSAIRFAFVGDGAEKERLRRRLVALRLSNVVLQPSVMRVRMPALLASADICLVSLRDITIFDSFVPSKIFELLAAGRPVIGAVAGEAADILSAAGAVVVPPEDPGALARAIRELAGDPHRQRVMSAAARGYAQVHCDRAVLAATYRDLLAGLP